MIVLIIIVVARLPAHPRATPEGVTISGNAFLLDGRPFIPQGFNVTAPLYSSWCAKGSTEAAARNFNVAELNTAKAAWDANALRFQVSQPVLAGANGAAYAEQIQTDADMALNDGFVVDISMQDQSLACGPAEPLPSQETEAAWTALIKNTSLSSNPFVMFELFNEPQNSPIATATTDPERSTWVDWLSGDRRIQPTSSERWSTYTPVGFQALVDYMRRTLDVGNVLIVDGASYAEDLEGVPILKDPGRRYQIAYAVHPYAYRKGEGNWNTRWGYLTGRYAVIATEWNYKASECGTAFETTAPQFLRYMRSSVRVGILGQALDVFSGEMMANRFLAPTQCGTDHPGSGFDFLHDYMEQGTGP